MLMSAKQEGKKMKYRIKDWFYKKNFENSNRNTIPFWSFKEGDIVEESEKAVKIHVNLIHKYSRNETCYTGEFWIPKSCLEKVEEE